VIGPDKMGPWLFFGSRSTAGKEFQGQFELFRYTARLCGWFGKVYIGKMGMG